MSLMEDIEKLAHYADNASDSFKRQLEMAKQSQQQSGRGADTQINRGVDRSKELRPIERPMIVRSRA